MDLDGITLESKTPLLQICQNVPELWSMSFEQNRIHAACIMYVLTLCQELNTVDSPMFYFTYFFNT